MTALAKERDTKRRSGDILILSIAATVICYAGGIAARDANGRATPGDIATTLRGVGRVKETVDNSAGADDAATVTIEKGIFAYGNSADTDEITRADIGNDCYIVDDQTVAKTSDTNQRSVAGKVFDVDSAGVWVDFR